MFQTLLTNLDFKSNVTKTVLNGKEYHVVPMVMITEGVFNGTEGPLYYSGAELGKSPFIWNMKPIVVYHPTLNGEGISACTPEVLERRQVGMIMNTKFSQERSDKTGPSKLKAEAWLDMEKVKQVDGRVYDAIVKNEAMNVSTGLVADIKNNPGTWNDKQYKYEATNYRPDHLAILPDVKGACSLEDGAGLLLNSKKITPLSSYAWPEEDKFAIVDQASFDEFVNNFRKAPLNKQPLIVQRGVAIAKKLNLKVPTQLTKISSLVRNVSKTLDDVVVKLHGQDAHVHEMLDDDRFVVNKKGKLIVHEFKLDEEDVTLVGEPVEVKIVREYQSSQGSILGNVNKELEMPKKKVEKETKPSKEDFINQLIGNEEKPGLFTEEDRDWLESQEDEKLEKLATAVVNEGKEEEAEEKKPAKKPAKKQVVQNQEEVDPNDDDDDDVEVYIKNTKMPPAVRDAMEEMLDIRRDRREELIELITNNEANPYEEEELEGMSLRQLNKLAILANSTKNKGEDKKKRRFVDYSGRGITLNEENGFDGRERKLPFAPLPLPSIKVTSDNNE